MSTAAPVIPADFAAPPIVASMRTRALIAGVVGVIPSVYFFLTAREMFLRSWLVAFMFWLGMTIGPLALLMLQYVTGGNWGRIGRRFWEAATKCLPLTFLFWLPIAIWIKVLHPDGNRKPEKERQRQTFGRSFPETPADAAPVSAGHVLQHQERQRADGHTQPEHERHQPRAQKHLPGSQKEINRGDHAHHPGNQCAGAHGGDDGGSGEVSGDHGCRVTDCLPPSRGGCADCMVSGFSFDSAAFMPPASRSESGACRLSCSA